MTSKREPNKPVQNRQMTGTENSWKENALERDKKTSCLISNEIMQQITT